MSNDEKLKSARGRPDVSCEDDDSLNPRLPPTGPVDQQRPNPYTNRTWDEPAPATAENVKEPFNAGKALLMLQMMGDYAQKGQFDRALYSRLRGMLLSVPPPEEQMFESIKEMMHDAERAAREVMGHGDAYACVSFTGQSGAIEIVWEIGVQRTNATRGEKGEGPAYFTRDMWGRAGSLEEALQAADVCKNPKGGRRT